MTTLMVVDGDRGERPSEAASRRLRGELGQRQISVSEVARRLGMKQPALSRRMTGAVPFDLDLLGEICQATGISFAYVTSGIRETPSPEGPDGGASAPSRARTYDLRIKSP